MEYIKPMFLLLFVLGIVAAVSSRHAAKHYPVEDDGNQDESSLVKKTLKGQGSSLTSAFDNGEEKNKRKVSSVSNMDDDSRKVSFDVYNPGNGVTWEVLNILILEGKKARELPTEVLPGQPIVYYVDQDPSTGHASGVFTYYLDDMAHTLAVMFHYIFHPSLANTGSYNVKIRRGITYADQALYDELYEDSKTADGGFHYMDMGSGFHANVKMSISDNPTLTVRDIHMPKMNRNTE